MNAPRKFSLFPKTVGRALDPLLKPLFKSRGLAGTNAVADWPRIVGKELAGHCWPEKISFPQGKKTGGTLTVACENGFSTEIQHMQPIILERLNVFYGYQAVTRLAISHSAVKATPSPTLPLEGEGSKRNALAGGGDQIKNTISDVTDPELKNALQSLANTLAGK